jgi:acetyl esterase/lipase
VLGGRSAVAGLLGALMAAGGLDAQAPVSLWPGAAPGSLGTTEEDTPSLMVYLPPPGRATGTGVVIFPGGGYVHLSMEKEGTDVARWLTGIGVAAFVVRYRLGPRYHYPSMLEDAQRAVRVVRARAGAWGVDPHRLGVIGFSAGGHMASTAGTHFDDGHPASEDPVEHQSSRPDFMILVYPVITMNSQFAHPGSRDNLLGANPSPELVQAMSNETQVTPKTPPTFLVASTNDTVVPVENSLMFYQALHAAGVPVEMHIYESGPHGFGLGLEDPAVATWPALCANWMRGHGWLTGVAPSR